MLDQLVLEALKAACARAGNQLELAKKTGVSQGQISDYLCGRRQIKNMTLGTLQKLFPELQVIFFQQQVPSAIDPINNEISGLLHTLTPEQKAYTLRLLVANFPADTIAKMKTPEK